VGLAIAVAIGMLIYRGSRRINLARFFRWTGISLVFIAAGLLASGIHEFIEIGVVTIGTHAAFDISGVLPDESGVGQFLHAIVGYSAAPEVTRLVVHLGYLAIVLVLYLRPAPPRLADMAKGRGVVRGQAE
jgi:high-affinity iron transporter